MSRRTYTNNYLSGPQIRIYFDDIYIDDIAYIEYGSMQNKRALYGYSSQHFDAVAKGTVLVTGSFSINFRFDGYVSAILNHYNDLKNAEKNRQATADISNKSIDLNNNQYKIQSDYASGIEDKAKPRKDLSIGKRSGKGAYIDNVQGQEKFNEQKFIDQLPSTYVNSVREEILTPNRNEELSRLSDDQIKALQDSIWANDTNKGNRLFSSAAALRPDNALPFSILVSFGNFDDPLNNIAEKIVNVHITNVSKAIDQSGNPITENYTFIAQAII